MKKQVGATRRDSQQAATNSTASKKGGANTGLSALFHQLRIPGYRRSVLLRRGLAGVLVCVAALLAVRSHSSDPEVVVFVRHVEAGTMITINDVALRERPAEFTPDGAFTATEDVMGTVAVSAAEPGEVVTGSRFISSELTATLVHGSSTNGTAGDKQDSGSIGEEADNTESAHMVPISLADPEVIPLLNHGDTVSVISEGSKDAVDARSNSDADHAAAAAPAPTDPTELGEHNSVSPASPIPVQDSTVIAEGARVIMAREATSAGNRATVMLALPSSAAQRVAVASLSTPLTVVLTGERATGKADT
ncbi:SAF domain-containing protein [Corynebacterium propinquum]